MVSASKTSIVAFIAGTLAVMRVPRRKASCAIGG